MIRTDDRRRTLSDARGGTVLKVVVWLAILVFVGQLIGQLLPIYVNFLRLRDTMVDSCLMSREKTDQQLLDRVAARAADLRIPVQASQITLRREGTHVTMHTEYDVELWLTPTYSIKWQMAPDAEAIVGGGQVP